MSASAPFGRLAAGPPGGPPSPAWRPAGRRRAAGSLAACAAGAGALAAAGWCAGGWPPAARDGGEVLAEAEATGGACGSTCVGHTCDYWLETNPFASCEVLEGRGCDCAGCRGCARGGGPGRSGPAPRSVLEGRAAAFPNPWSDPGACGLPDRGYLCDPGDVLSKPCRLAVAKALATIWNTTSVKCEDGEGYGYQVGLAIVSRILPDGWPVSSDVRVKHEEVDEFAVALFDSWGIGNGDCGNGVLLLLGMDLRYFYIRTASATRLVISDARAEEITSSVHGELALGRYDEAMTDAVRSVQEILGQAGESEPSWLWPAVLGCGLACFACCCAWSFAPKMCPHCRTPTLNSTLVVEAPPLSCSAAGTGIRTYACSRCGYSCAREESVAMPCAFVGGYCAMCGIAESGSSSGRAGGGGFGGGYCEGGGGGGDAF